MSYGMTFVLVFFGLIVLSSLLVYWIGLKIKAQAKKPKKRFFGPIPKPGQFYFLVLEGGVVKVVENVVNETLDDKRRFIPGNKQHGFLEQKLGFIWMGLFAEVGIVKKWQWPEFKQITATENSQQIVKYETVGRQEDVTDFFKQFTYSLRMTNVELAGNIKADLTMDFTVHYLYPEFAIFGNKDTVSLFISTVIDSIRPWVSGKEFDVIKAISNSGDQSVAQAGDGFWKMLERLNGITLNGETPNYDGPISPLGLYKLLGIVIKRANFTDLAAVGKAAEATEREKIAVLDGRADLAAAGQRNLVELQKAQTDAATTLLRATAEATRRRQTIVEIVGGPGEAAAEVLVAEEVNGPNSKVQTWVQGDRRPKPNNLISIPISTGDKPREDRP